MNYMKYIRSISIDSLKPERSIYCKYDHSLTLYQGVTQIIVS